MNQLVFIQNDDVLTDSITIAEMFDKRHDIVLRDIRNTISSLGRLSKSKEVEEMGIDMGVLKFVETYYTNQQNKQPYPKFLLNFDSFMLVTMSYTTQKAMLIKVKYINEFNYMKAELEKSKKPVSIEDLIIMQAQSVKELKAKMKIQDKQLQDHSEKLQVINHRVDNLDNVNISGDLQQRLNKMVKRYAWQNGLKINQAWKDFDQAFNTAYRTNLTARRNNYAEKHGFKEITRPQYLSLTNQLEDAIRVADKMLNTERKVI